MLQSGFSVLMLLVLWLIVDTLSVILSLAKPGCEDSCGNITIPYPFGIGSGCSLDASYAIRCDSPSGNSSDFPRPNLTACPAVEVLAVSSVNQSTRVRWPVILNCEAFVVQRRYTLLKSLDLSGSSFLFSKYYNRFTFLGCGNGLIGLNQWEDMAGCSSLCFNNYSEVTRCYGINCWQTTFPFHLNIYYRVRSTEWHYSVQVCLLGGGKLVPRQFPRSFSVYWQSFISVVLSWTFAEEGIENCNINVLELGNGSSVWNLRCTCGLHGQGSPYFSDGCQATATDNVSLMQAITSATKQHQKVLAIGISMMILLLTLNSFWLYKVVQKREQET